MKNCSFFSLSLYICTLVVWCKISPLLRLQTLSSFIPSWKFSILQHLGRRAEVYFFQHWRFSCAEHWGNVHRLGHLQWEIGKESEREWVWKSTIFLWRLASQRSVLLACNHPCTQCVRNLGQESLFCIVETTNRRQPLSLGRSDGACICVGVVVEHYINV